uniref:CCHC-type domain-containing protein n=1 Tax=Anopheles maculatus TaxID=74869 RepID=A0A182SZ61_9DIPT
MRDISLHMFRNGLQSARMRVPSRAASIIIGKRLQVGMSAVTLWERKMLPAEQERCYKCMRLGHRAARCQEEDRRRLCFRCGRDDHRLRACTNQSAWIAAGSPGRGLLYASRGPSWANNNVIEKQTNVLRVRSR